MTINNARFEPHPLSCCRQQTSWRCARGQLIIKLQAIIKDHQALCVIWMGRYIYLQTSIKIIINWCDACMHAYIIGMHGTKQKSLWFMRASEESIFGHSQPECYFIITIISFLFRLPNWERTHLHSCNSVPAPLLSDCRPAFSCSWPV